LSPPRGAGLSKEEEYKKRKTKKKSPQAHNSAVPRSSDIIGKGKKSDIIVKVKGAGDSFPGRAQLLHSLFSLCFYFYGPLHPRHVVAATLPAHTRA
jgi:hypothetical protein